jgi:hypothetical protein
VKRPAHRGRSLLTAATLLIPTTLVSQQRADEFNHEAHRGLFPSCLTCHVGAAQTGQSLWPAPTACETCHDGQIESRVGWRPRSQAPATNLRFDHGVHETAVREDGAQSVRCIDCHSQEGAPWLSVQLSAVSRCLECHDVSQDHFSAPAATCAQCHVPLARATRISFSTIQTFPTPQSHDAANFGTTGHGVAAGEGGTGEIAASCATCHARDFCITCHVDAPERTEIQTLDPDRRSLAHRAVLEEPASHESADFLTRHGTDALSDPTSCATCHTQESCTTCHIATPEVAIQLHRTAPGRGPGAAIERSSPQSHDPAFREQHGSSASAVPGTCAGCHAREDCLDCHLPDPARAPRAYHAVGFLARHPSSAYSRETDCADCHNDRAFCTDCHLATGLTVSRDGVLGSGFHDAKRAFALGHGPAARQTLETCVTCHTENDCLSCHSAIGARRYSPHGPGFDAERLRIRSPETCRVCHGSNIPGAN